MLDARAQDQRSSLAEPLRRRGVGALLPPGSFKPLMRRLWTPLKFGLEYFGFRLAGLILGTMRVETASNFSGWLWRRLAPRFRRHERALSHLATAFPDKTPPEIEAIAVAM